MTLDRRTFLKAAGAGGAALAVSPVPCQAAASRQAFAVLVDTTRCLGCRACEAACAEANALPAPAGGEEVFAAARATTTDAFTVVGRAAAPGPDGGPRYAKTQCMHCVDPACASACPVRALVKLDAGPVVYHRDRCMGCRYCMVACPFAGPRYQYDKPIPYVRKCDFCAGRQAAGQLPACVEVCPSGALTFGPRDQKLDEARRRVYAPGSGYVPHVYGEDEAGGTSWLYIGDVAPGALGLPDVRTRSYATLADGALGAVPVVLTLGAPVLMALRTLTRRKGDAEPAAEAAGPREGSHV
jgi:Fe-S-cluster-containing dehydrogenase component